MNVWRLGLEAKHDIVQYYVGVQNSHKYRGENFMNIKRKKKKMESKFILYEIWRLGIEANYGPMQYNPQKCRGENFMIIERKKMKSKFVCTSYDFWRFRLEAKYGIVQYHVGVPNPHKSRGKKSSILKEKKN